MPFSLSVFFNLQICFYLSHFLLLLSFRFHFSITLILFSSFLSQSHTYLRFSFIRTTSLLVYLIPSFSICVIPFSLFLSLSFSFAFFFSLSPSHSISTLSLVELEYCQSCAMLILGRLRIFFQVCSRVDIPLF